VTSDYQGALVSDQFFTQKEINHVPKAKRQAQIQQPLKKVEPTVHGTPSDDLEEVMRASASSFFSQHSRVSEEQASIIKSKPFQIKARAAEDSYEEIESVRASASKLLATDRKEAEIEDLERYLDEIKTKCGIADKAIDQMTQEHGLDASFVSSSSAAPPRPLAETNRQV
jgi:hypothetical protein